ncbi:EamA-like transporter family (Partial), partial [Seminavis robusta]
MKKFGLVSLLFVACEHCHVDAFSSKIQPTGRLYWVPTATATVVRASTIPQVEEDSEQQTSLNKLQQEVASSAIVTTATTTTTTEPQSTSPLDGLAAVLFGQSSSSGSREYQRGLITIGFITLLFSSNSPVLHAAFTSSSGNAPPVLLLNAGVSVVALVGLLLGGETLENNTELPSSLLEQQQQLKTGQPPQEQFLEPNDNNNGLSFLNNMMDEDDQKVLQGGCELGLWKFLGTTANIYGLSLTTAAHGAFLIQLTTLIVPVVQGIMGVPIPKRIQFSIVLALAGVVCFTQDPTGTPSLVGDVLCVIAAAFYATYDLRL